MNSAICSLCEQLKPEEAFYADRGCRRARCIQCDTAPDKTLLLEQKRARDEAWLLAYWTEWPAMSRQFPGDWPANEEWRPVPSYICQYDVSDKGRVRSHWEHKHNNYYRRPIPKVLSPHEGLNCYPAVTLVDWHTGDHDTKNIHSLVLEAFRGFRPSARHVGGHRDGTRNNNNLENLEWITYAENEADKRRHGRALTGEKNHLAKLTPDEVREIRRMWKLGCTCKQIAFAFDISPPVAHKAATRRSYQNVGD